MILGSDSNSSRTMNKSTDLSRSKCMLHYTNPNQHEHKPYFKVYSRVKARQPAHGRRPMGFSNLCPGNLDSKMIRQIEIFFLGNLNFVHQQASSPPHCMTSIKSESKERRAIPPTCEVCHHFSFELLLMMRHRSA